VEGCGVEGRGGERIMEGWCFIEFQVEGCGVGPPWHAASDRATLRATFLLLIGLRLRLCFLNSCVRVCVCMCVCVYVCDRTLTRRS
jgi:hypothetical protein